jgi:hypothetical protein
MARFIMIIVLSGMVTFGISNISQNSTVNQGTQNVVDNFSNNRAHDIATSMTDILMMRLSNDLEYRVNSVESEDLFGEEVSYIVEDTFFEGDSLVRIIVAAKFDGVEKIITTYTSKPTSGWVPPVVRGAWTANDTLNNTISDMFIDGRDHDLDQNLIPTSGIYGVSTSTDFVNTENAAIGGTNNYVDYPMTFPEIDEVIEENYEWDGGFPESPDAILGFPEGTLKDAAISGEYGGQYLINPPKDGKYLVGLTYPISGVTYIEINNGQEYEIELQESGNSGILVFHNDDRNSVMKGIKFEKDTFAVGFSDGLFTGLLVGDYTFHHHIDVLGGIILLSPDLETSKSCNGNKDHWVKYSSEAIMGATEIVAEISGLSGNVGYGFGKKRVKVCYVYE